MAEPARAAGVNVQRVCAQAGMSRQNYYAGRRVRERAQVAAAEVAAAEVVALVQAERAVPPRIGGRKLWRVLGPALAAAGVTLGRDRFFAVLRAGDLLLAPRRSAAPCTTHSSHCLPVFKNEIRALELAGPNEVWVSDVTYVRTREGFVYLSLITDKWSRKIVGHCAAADLTVAGTLRALEGALAELPAGTRPIHHSDRGSQYCCHEYVARLAASGLGISMTEVDHCAENALAERVNGILKGEYALDGEFADRGQAGAVIATAVRLYNTRRLHTALGYRVPAVVHAGEG